MNLNVLLFLSTQENYEKYRKYIKDNILTKESKMIVHDLSSWYKEFNKDVDWSDFEDWFLAVKHPTLKEERVEVFSKLFFELDRAELDEDMEESLLNTFVTRDYATRLYISSQKAAEGIAEDLDECCNILQEYEDVLDKALEIESYEKEWDIDSIIDHTVGKGGLEWRLPCFNLSLGPLRDGNFIILGARPDTGKTTMLASEATHMATQLPDDKRVLWFNNEEAGETVQLRILQAALGVTAAHIKSDKMGAMEEYTRIMGIPDRIKVFDRADLSIDDVNAACKKYNAGLIIFDQLWKLHGVPASVNDVNRMTTLFNHGREWAKQYAPVITVHQADATAEGMTYLTQDKLYMSKTGAQGEADGIIMIGRSHEPGMGDSRFIAVPKNKLPPSSGMDEKFRNMHREVLIKPEIARFEEVSDE